MWDYTAKPDGAREAASLADASPSEGEPELMEAALHYVQYDIPIFPVWNPTENGGCACPRGLDCPSPAKHPVGFLVPRGLQAATKDPDRVQEW